MIRRSWVWGFLFSVAVPFLYCGEGKITPYKYEDALPIYSIPKEARHPLPRAGGPDIIYYFSPPDRESFPIAVLCEGSADESYITSVIHFHRYFLQECQDLHLGVVTVERWGVDGEAISPNEWISHYTRSQRLADHQSVIEHLILQPPAGWNGKLVFIGVSEGGPLVTALSAKYKDRVLATINWSGAGAWSWKEELWAFFQPWLVAGPDCMHGVRWAACGTCSDGVGDRARYDALWDTILSRPVTEEYFLGMTYLYHADAMNFLKVEYSKLQKPFLVVSGALDTIIDSSDLFVEKAKQHGVPITYYRIEDMDHYVRKRPKVLKDSFAWLAEHLDDGDTL